MASRKPTVAAPADSQDPEMPDHDLEPPRFARRALERLLNDWPAVSAMLSTGETYYPLCANPSRFRLSEFVLHLRLDDWNCSKR